MGWIVFLRYLIKSILTSPPSRVWKLILLFTAFHFLTSWYLIWIFEPQAEFVKADTFFWFYIVSATTIGYGDFSPSELGSRIVTVAYMFPFGLVLMGYAIGGFANIFTKYTHQRRTGVANLKLKDHIVVFGEDDPHCASMIQNLMKETGQSVCLVSEHQTNPLEGFLDNFVSGDILNPEVRNRCCLKDAKTVIIYSQNDNQTVGETLMALEETGNECRIISYFQDAQSAKRFNRQSHDRVSCVSSIDMSVVVQEALDEGCSEYVSKLTDNNSGATFMKLSVPEGFQGAEYRDIVIFLLERGVSTLGLYGQAGQIKIVVSPLTMVYAGMELAVACVDRSDIESIDWNIDSRAGQ